MTDQYIIDFNLSEMTKQLSDLQNSYNEFGSSLKDIFGTSIEDVKELSKSMDELTTSIASAYFSLDTSYSLLNKNMSETASILESIHSAGKELGSMSVAVGGAVSSAGNVADIYPELAKNIEDPGAKDAADAAQMASEALDLAKQALKQIDSSQKELKKELSGLGKILKEELSSAKQAASSGLSTILGPASSIVKGGVVGALVGAVFLGIAESQRLDAEMGEVSNVFESSIDGLGSKAVNKATEWIGAFQEKAQKFYAISKEEVQSQLSAFVGMGYEVEQFMSTYDKTLGEVGANIPTVTLALEKHLNLAGGSAAKNVNIMVGELGDSLDEATDKFMRMAFAAQRSGMEVNKFVGSIMSGAQSMRQYGIDVEDVTQVMQKLKGYYEDMMGPDSEQFAGAMAAGALGGIAGGLSNISDPYAALLARELVPQAEGYAGIQEVKSGISRVISGEDKDWFIKFIKANVKVAERQVGGDRTAMIEFLRRNVNLSVDQSKALIDIAPNLKEGVKIDEKTEKQLEKFMKTFETEGSVLTDLQKNQNQLIKDLAKIGGGIMKILSGILGILTSIFRSVPSLFKAFFAKPEDREKILESVEDLMLSQVGTVISGFEDVFAGSGDLLGTFGKTIMDLFENLKEVYEWESPETRPISAKDVAGAMAISKEKSPLRKAVKALGGSAAQQQYDAFNEAINNMGESVIDYVDEEVDKAKEGFEEGDPFQHPATVGPQASLIPSEARGGSYMVEGVIRNRDLASAMNVINTNTVYS